MKNYALTPAFTIKGIAAASGLVFTNNSLYIISDNSTFLYHYNIENQSLEKIPLDENAQENIPKKEKADFESITLFNNKLYLYGSGSTEKREKRFSFDLATKTINQKAIGKLYKKLKKHQDLDDDTFNIEGVIHTNSQKYFFQRGNKDSNSNGIFTIEKETKTIDFIRVSLPKIQEIEATFTDAILFENTIYFLAAVENSQSTYLDGEILGTFFGSLQAETFEINFCQQISNNQKFEGLTICKHTNNEKEFYLCEDNDIQGEETTIYKLKLL